MPKLADVRVRDRFDQRDVSGGLADDPKIQLRTRMFEEMIPHDVEPILDVGSLASRDDCDRGVSDSAAVGGRLI